MSDTGRESFTEQAKSSLKPDSEKSNTEHAKDNVKGTYDNMAGSAQPESQKSYTQQATDKLTGKGGSDKSWTQSTKETLGMGDK